MCYGQWRSMKAKAKYRPDLKRWMIRVTIDGQRKSIYGLSEEEALEKARQSLKDAETRSLSSPSWTGTPTLAEFAMRSYLPTIVHRSKAHQDAVTWAFGKFLPELGKMPVDTIKRPDIQRVIDGLTVGSKKDVLAKLHAVMELAIDDELIARNPCRAVVLPKQHRKPKQVFTAEELARLIVASEGMVCRNAILFGCLGVCRGESLGIKWPLKDTVKIVEQLDGADLKTENRYREIPLPTGFVELLDGPRWGYVVKCRDLGNITGMKANPDKKLRARGFHRAVELAGLKPGRTFHDLRHSVSTLLVQKGCHPFVKDAILGHTKQSMSAYYTSYPDLMAQMRTALDAVFGDIREHTGQAAREKAS